MPRSLLVPALIVVFLWGWAAFAHAAPDQSAPGLQQTDASGSAPPPEPVPVVELPETTHDLGLVRSGQPCEYSFTVKNKGAAPLKIYKVAVG